MPVKTTLKSRALDDKDKKILMMLQENGRVSLKKISEKVKLSSDTVHQRIKEMQRKEIMKVTTSITPWEIGFPMVADVKIRLKDAGEKERDEFIKSLQRHPRCTDLIAIMGEYDFTCVLIAKNSADLEKLSTGIRLRFKDIINEWKSNLVLKTYKFDTYDLN